MSPATFVGALLPVCDVDVLIVAVQPWILASAEEARLYVTAFALRFRRTIVLMAQDRRRVPTYYGPAPIVLALRALPFEIIPWRRIPYRAAPRRSWKLPIPPEPPPNQSCETDASWRGDVQPTHVLERTVAAHPRAANRGRSSW